MSDPTLDTPLRVGLNLTRALGRWHRHDVVGLEHVPAEGPVLLAVNHSLATYDIALLCAKIYKRHGRLPRGLADRAMFTGPDGGRLARSLGFVEGTPENGQHLLATGQLAVVAPGGMREALRPSDERYHVRWATRRGFVRLAMQTGTPIVLAACPDADRLYHVYDNQLTKLVYAKARLPLPIVRGWGPTLVPRPVRLTHVLSPPQLPPSDDVHDDVAVETWHTHLVDVMNGLMAEARALGDTAR